MLKPRRPCDLWLHERQKAAFYQPKGHQSHAKRPSFASKKTTFYNPSDNQRLTRLVQDSDEKAIFTTPALVKTDIFQ